MEGGVLAPQPRDQCQEEESPQHPAVKISGDSLQVRSKVAGNPGILLKDLHTDSLTNTHLRLQQRKSSLNDVRATEITALCGFRARAEGWAAFSPGCTLSLSGRCRQVRAGTTSESALTS